MEKSLFPVKSSPFQYSFDKICPMGLQLGGEEMSSTAQCGNRYVIALPIRDSNKFFASNVTTGLFRGFQVGSQF